MVNQFYIIWEKWELCLGHIGIIFKSVGKNNKKTQPINYHDNRTNREFLRSVVLNLQPITYISKDDDYPITYKTVFDYNQYHDLISKINYIDEKVVETNTYKYTYDEQNNWTYRSQYKNGKIYESVERKIIYY